METPVTSRVCPECLDETNESTCPKCGVRTVLDRRKAAGSDPLVGRTLEGRYRIDATLGRGGMGSVYRATHLAMNRTVAVKVIKAELAADLEAVRRFQREARAASLLSHPNTIRVFDFGETDDGSLFLVMEYLDGRTLAALMEADGRLPERRAAHIAFQVVQSLSEAHAAGLVHRDLKPQNILLQDVVGSPDFVKVLDFGIVKFLGDGTGSHSSMTSTGAVIGTPHYMAPEQAQGLAPDPRTDVYALGVILYEMLTGTRPFTADSPMMVLMAHVNEPMPTIPAGIGVSRAMRDLVGRMTGKDASRRPAAGRELLEALDALRNGRIAEDDPPTVDLPSSALDHLGPTRLHGIAAPEADRPARNRGVRTRGRKGPGVAIGVVAFVGVAIALAAWLLMGPDVPGAGTAGPATFDALPFDAQAADVAPDVSARDDHVAPTPDAVAATRDAVPVGDVHVAPDAAPADARHQAPPPVERKVPVRKGGKKGKGGKVRIIDF